MTQGEAWDAVFGTAMRSAVVVWWAGCWFRVACVAGMWGVLVAAGVPDAPRAVAQLGFTTVGVGIAFLHTRVDTLTVLRRTRLPPVSRLAAHLLGTPGAAKMDVPGAAETIGAVTAFWLFAGPAPLPGLAPAARITAMVLALAYSLSAALQGMVDPGWYNPAAPPSRGMRRLRVAMPLVFCAMLAVYLFPFNAADRALPFPLYVVLSSTPLLFYPLWAGVDVVLNASAEHTVARQRLWRQDVAVEIHSVGRNAVSLLSQYLEEPDPDLREVSRLTREALLRVEEVRLDILRGPDAGAAATFGDLWELTMRTFPGPRGTRCETDAESREVVLAGLDYQIGRRLLPDLLTNALNAGASAVRVRCAAEEGSVLRLTVVDDGPGLTVEPAAADRAESSSHLLKRWLDAYDGAIGWRSGDQGTIAEARWRSQGSRAGADRRGR